MNATGIGYDEAANSIGAPIRRAPQQVRSTNYYVRTVLPSVYFSMWRARGGENIGVYLSMYGDDAERIYRLLETDKLNVERAFGEPLRWRERTTGSAYWIIADEMTGSSDEADWPRQHDWLAARMKRLADAVGPALAAIPPAEGSA